MKLSLIELDEEFQHLLVKEHNWPGPVADPKSIYTGFDAIHDGANNIICACCGCLEHMFSNVEMVSVTEPYLTVLAVKHEHVPTFNFACGISVLDSQNIMIDRGGILLSDDMSNPILTICKPCNYKLQQRQLPP